MCAMTMLPGIILIENLIEIALINNPSSREQDAEVGNTHTLFGVGLPLNSISNRSANILIGSCLVRVVRGGGGEKERKRVEGQSETEEHSIQLYATEQANYRSYCQIALE